MGVHDKPKRLKQEAYASLRGDMIRRGHDPNFIGAHEVQPVCCKKCGEPIPWATLRGWQD